MNSISIVGRVAFDAELKTSASGVTFCRFRFASDVGFGERKKTLWLDGVLFGKRAESLTQYLTKGTQIVVVGELEPAETYDSKGETRISQGVMVRDISLVGGKKENANQPAARQEPAPDFNDDIPF